MSLYFFEVDDLPDDTGVVLDGVKEARAEARRRLSTLIGETDVAPGECKSWSCAVRDENGRMIQRIVLATLVEDPRERPDGIRTFHPV